MRGYADYFHTFNSKKMNKKNFDALDEKEQWAWLLANKDLVEQIDLDNDVTYISFRGEEDESRFKSDIGNRQGVNYLLEALGFSVYDV